MYWCVLCKQIADRKLNEILTNYKANYWAMSKKNLWGEVRGIYQTPQVELFEVQTEKGFANSFVKEEEEF